MKQRCMLAALFLVAVVAALTLELSFASPNCDTLKNCDEW